MTHSHDSKTHDPIQQALSKQGSFNQAWIGKTKQSLMQKIGFLALSAFLLGAGIMMCSGLFHGGGISNLVPFMAGSFFSALGLSGVAKVCVPQADRLRFRRRRP